MATFGPLIIVDDDIDDEEIVREALTELAVPNKVHYFSNGETALQYLQTTAEQPFLILCDVNMPKMGGIELKRQIDADPELRSKSIPFIFFTTTVDEGAVVESYTTLTVQGFFRKSNRYEELKDILSLITNYWKHSYHPNR